MPTAQVLHAIAETVVNPLLKLDPNSEARLAELRGARLTVWLAELQWPVQLVFEHDISIHEAQTDWNAACEQLQANECLIKTSLSTLPELRDNRKITQLIRDEKLDLSGDMHIAQQVSQLFQSLSIDWEEVLSQHIGDVAAHEFVKGVKTVDKHLKQKLSRLGDTLGSALIDEKKLAAHKLQVMHFSDQVTDIRNDVERLDARIVRLEQN